MKSLLLLALMLFPLSSVAAEKKPVLLYSQYFNAKGENRYPSTGAYRDLMELLGQDFEVRVNADPITEKTLRDVKLLLVANPNDTAYGTNPPPHHIDQHDVQAITSFVRRGGGLMMFGNQENHNLEVKDANKLLAQFGIQATNLYTDAKKLVIPADVPVIGGLRWAYYTGNSLVLDEKHPAHPKALVRNDLTQKPAKGPRDQEGVLMASAAPGKGHVVIVTDAGWVTGPAFSGEGIGGVSIKEQDNKEIMRRIARWAAGLK
jgi:hypothetical protein